MTSFCNKHRPNTLQCCQLMLGWMQRLRVREVWANLKFLSFRMSDNALWYMGTNISKKEFLPHAA